MVYFDTSALLALFVPDVWSTNAREIGAKLRHAIQLTDLGEIELMTRIHRALGENRLKATEHFHVLRQFEQDVADGIIVRKRLNPQAHIDESLRLARSYAPKLAIRSLDILHVASAKLLGCRSFASFDRRQRQLASAVRIKLLPTTLT